MSNVVSRLLNQSLRPCSGAGNRLPVVREVPMRLTQGREALTEVGGWLPTPPRRLLPCLLALVSLSLPAPTLVRARTIADKLHKFIDTNGFPTASDFPETITPIVERLALRGIDFPVTAT